jgi:uncharacterized membrane protein YhhN
VNGTAAGFLAAAVVAAAADWIAVGRDDRRTEYLAKPLTMALLVGAALTLDPVDDVARAWFVVALLASLAGDVFLMLPRDRFVAGLASFLLGHLAYTIGLLQLGSSAAGFLAGVVVVGLVVPLLGTRIVGAVRSRQPELLLPVVAYVAVISMMVVSAGVSGEPVALAAAVSFYASDALIAWTRFVSDVRFGRVAVMVTYHLAQLGFVYALT